MTAVLAGRLHTIPHNKSTREKGGRGREREGEGREKRGKEEEEGGRRKEEGGRRREGGGRRVPALAIDTLCCSMASSKAWCSCFILSNSSIQQIPEKKLKIV
jgi:hypothetical protein